MTPRKSPRVVLVVEDDSPTRDFYCSLLRGTGFTVIGVEDGMAALHVLDTQIPDAVVLDIELPRVSGRDVYGELKARPDTQGVPIVIVSGYDTTAFLASDSPEVRIFGKPVDAQVLLTAVEQCVGRRRKYAESA